jgi:hypothetical protein
MLSYGYFPAIFRLFFLMTTLRTFIPILVAISISAQLGLADDDSWRKPLGNRNQFPPSLLFISMEPERAAVLAKGDRSLGLNFDYSNILVFRKTDREELFLDAEYLRTDFRFETGLGKGLEVRASIPFTIMYGGFLDSFLSSFHKTLNLPNAGRDDFSFNELHYFYSKDGATAWDRPDDVAAFGDLTLQVKKALWEKDQNELAARAAVKLPTGSRSNLTGSGKTDFALGFMFNRVGPRFGGYFNINYSFLGKPDELDTRNHFSLMGAFDWRFKPNLAMVIQYDHIDRFLSSEIRELNQSARQLVLGLRWRRSDRNQLEWRFAEDISTTAPDFTLGFQWTIQWRGGEKP